MKRIAVLCVTAVLMLGMFAGPATANSSQKTVVERHRFLGVNLASHSSVPYWTWDGKKLLSSHSGTNYNWHNVGVSASESDPFWMRYPTGKASYGVFYSKMKFGVGVTAYGLPLGYEWVCQLAAHCYYDGTLSYGETCSF